MHDLICDKLHNLFTSFKRHCFPFDQRLIPANGIYVLFEKGELAHGGLDRVVRVGTHTGSDNLPQRLVEHFVKENKDRSVFRKNIGRALLNEKHDSFLEQWDRDLTAAVAREMYGGQVDAKRVLELEKKVSTVIRNSFTFCVFPIDDKGYRLELEKRLISTINHCHYCGPSMLWLGRHSPKSQIRESGLWVVQGLSGPEMTSIDLRKLEQLARSRDHRSHHADVPRFAAVVTDGLSHEESKKKETSMANTCREAIRDIFIDEATILNTSEVIDQINAHYPHRPWKVNTISAHLVGLSVNRDASKNFPTLRRHGFLFSLGNGRFRKWNRAIDGTWDVINRSVQRIDSPIERENNQSIPAKLVITPDDLARWRRQIIRLLNGLEGHPNQQEGLVARIRRLSRDGQVPREMAALLAMIVEMRNAVEYEEKRVSTSEGRSIQSAWEAIREWAEAQSISL